MMRLPRFRYYAPSTVKEALRRWYGPKGDAVRNAEAFEMCEYGRRPSEEDLRRLFPFAP